MNRRGFLIAAAAVFAPKSCTAQGSSTNPLAARVAEVETEIGRRRTAGAAIPADWLAAKLGEGLSERERRVTAFHLIRNVPYKLTAWKGDPQHLFALGRGDCRHKSAALLRLLRSWKLEARPVQVPFDWADLPIPRRVLEPLLETRGIHDSVEAKIDNRFVLVDPTWDPALGKAGFPVLADWDGQGATPAVTAKADTVVRPGDLKAGTDLFAHFGINWPRRERTLVFNRGFNAWTDEVRAPDSMARR